MAPKMTLILTGLKWT